MEEIKKEASGRRPVFSSVWLGCARCTLRFPPIAWLVGVTGESSFSLMTVKKLFNAQTFLQGWELEFRPKLSAFSLGSVLSGESSAGDTGVKQPSEPITLLK